MEQKTVNYPIPIWTEKGQVIQMIELDSDIAAKLMENILK